MATLEVWLKAGHTVEIIRRLLPNFCASSGHEVRISIVPEARAHDELLSGEQAPDIVTAPFWYLEELRQQGILSALTFDDVGLQESNFVEHAVNSLSVHGELLAVPHTLTGGVLSYRTDLLEANSLPEPRSLQDVLVASRSLRAAGSPGLIARANAEFSSLETYAGWAAARGTKILPDVGVPRYEDLESGCGDLVDLLRDDGERVVRTDYAGLGQMMLDGQASMLFDTSAWSFQFEDACSPIRGKIGYSVLREHCAAQFHYAEGLAVTSWSRYPEAAREFIAWRHSEEVVRAEVEQIGRIDFPRWDIHESGWYRDFVRERSLSGVLSVIEEAWDASDDAHVASRSDFVAQARKLMGVITASISGEADSLAEAYETTYQSGFPRR